jgi:hypothetical protein
MRRAKLEPGALPAFSAVDRAVSAPAGWSSASGPGPGAGVAGCPAASMRTGDGHGSIAQPGALHRRTSRGQRLLAGPVALGRGWRRVARESWS